MWIMNTVGFFSVVHSGEGELMIRARVEKDLDRLLAAMADYEHTRDPQIIHTPRADYPFRIIVTSEAFARYMADDIRHIDYTNFKSEVAKTDPARSHRVYGEVWSVLREGLDARAHDAAQANEELPFPEAAMGGPNMPVRATTKKTAKKR